MWSVFDRSVGRMDGHSQLYHPAYVYTVYSQIARTHTHTHQLASPIEFQCWTFLWQPIIVTVSLALLLIFELSTSSLACFCFFLLFCALSGMFTTCLGLSLLCLRWSLRLSLVRQMNWIEHRARNEQTKQQNNNQEFHSYERIYLPQRTSTNKQLIL